MKIKIMQGDCIERMKELADNSVDSVVTDPPAGISFLGKAWDGDKGGKKQWISWLASVMQECLRVLKPGGHALVWAIPRTAHWTMDAIDDAGFEIRDVIVHIFGSGFPKSLDIGKAIDKELGCVRKPIGTQKLRGTARIKGGGAHSVSSSTGNYATHEIRDIIPITAPASPEAQQYDGWGTALKPATEHWILCRKPIETNNVASNVLKYGTGGINIEDCRVEGEGGGWNGKTSDRSGKTFESTGLKNTGVPSAPDGRWPANLVHDGTPEVEALFPYSKTGGKKGTPTTSLTKNTILRNAPGTRDGKEVVLAFRAANEGSASRFFNKVSPDDPAETEEIQKAIYCKKASQKDRDENNRHPTVKSTELMRFLCRLITPKGGTVLDPFMGSGSTGKAAILEGFSFIGIDNEPEYVIIAKERLIACAKSTQRKDKNES